MTQPFTLSTNVSPSGKLAALGLQHVLVMPCRRGGCAPDRRARLLSPEQVAMLISADLFCCGVVTLIQSLGATQWFGIKLPVMMGVTFAAVGPWWPWPTATPGWPVPAIFGAIIGAGVICIPIAPIVSRMPRYFPRWSPAPSLP